MANIDNNELMEFMMKELGGKSEVIKKFYLPKIVELSENSGTVGELIKSAQEGEWLNILTAMKVKDFGNLISPQPTKATKERTGKRLTKDEKNAMVEGILNVLKDGQPRSKGEIAQAIGFDASKLGPQLTALRNEGKVASTGEKANMVYTIGDGKTIKPHPKPSAKK